MCFYKTKTGEYRKVQIATEDIICYKLLEISTKYIFHHIITKNILVA